MRSLAEVLSGENRALLHTIWQSKPQSIAELATTTGRKPSNLSRTLKTMARYGLVDMHPQAADNCDLWRRQVLGRYHL
jgi:predicted transcriptional regulator